MSTADLAELTPFNLKEKVAVVTGAASGIGRATAILLARCGAQVYASDLVLDRETSAVFNRVGISERQCDVRRLDQLQSFIDIAASESGRLDILINNAGINCVGQVGEIEEADWDHCLDTNLKAAFFGAKYAVPHLQRSGGGSIVNTASNAGLLPRAHDPVYSISKQALVGLTKSLALCHARDRIRVNCVCPGPVSGTRMMSQSLSQETDAEAASMSYISASPLAGAHRRMISPDEVAHAITYLCSDAAMMVTGTSVAIDGGKSLGIPPARRL